MKKTLSAIALLFICLLLGCEVQDIYDRGGDDKSDNVSTKSLPDGTIITTIQSPIEVNGTNMTQVTTIATHPDGTTQTNVTYTIGTLVMNGAPLNTSNLTTGVIQITPTNSTGGGFVLNPSGTGGGSYAPILNTGGSGLPIKSNIPTGTLHMGN